MQKCAKIGHNFREIKSDLILPQDVKKEKCLDCGLEETFSSKNWNEDREYSKAHRRDFIQPWMTEEWKLAYPDKPVVTDSKRGVEIMGTLNQKMGKKKLPKIAEEYLRSFGWTEKNQAILLWHLKA